MMDLRNDCILKLSCRVFMSFRCLIRDFDTVGKMHDGEPNPVVYSNKVDEDEMKGRMC